MVNFGYIKIQCNSCDHESKVDYEKLNSIYTNKRFDEDLRLLDICKILPYFKCSVCNSKSLGVLKKEGDLIFDTDYSRRCQSCNIHLPLNMNEYNKCIECRHDEEIQDSKGPEFPLVPAGHGGGCPRCKKNNKKGIVVVYQNSLTKEFFLGCSRFPKCRWSENPDQDDFL